MSARLSRRDRARLVALADDVLQGRRREVAAARIAALPDGSALLERQRRVRRALRAGLAAERPLLAEQRARRDVRPRLALALLAAAALVLTLLLAAPVGRSPLTSQAAALSTRSATEPAPAGFEGVRFPDWGAQFGWHARGARRDTVGGRDTRTVFYEHEGHRIGYTVIAGPPVQPPSDAPRVRGNGVEVTLLRADGRDVAIFERNGRTCVLAGHVEHPSTLVELAAWNPSG